MKRSFKKALAFALATVTVVANFGVSTPVTAAEYDAVKDVLPSKYDDYVPFNDGYLFLNQTEVKKSETDTDWYVDELVFVDKNGEKSTMEVKNTDGSYKYTYVSYVSNDCVAYIYDDSTYSLCFADGTWLGNGTEKYKEITILEDDKFFVVNDTTCNVVDKTGKVIAKDIFKPIKANYSYCWPYYEFGDYIILGRNYYTADSYDEVNEIKIFDKNYKEVTTGIDFKDCDVRVIKDTYMVLYDISTATFYDSNLKKLDYVFKQDVVTNPSVSADGEAVLVDYRIDGIWTMHDYKGNRDVIEVVAENVYEDALGNTNITYEPIYLDMKTFAVLDEDELQFYVESKENKEVENTDLSYKHINGIITFYNGTTKLFDMDSIEEYIYAKKPSSEGNDVGLFSFAGSSGDLYLSIDVNAEDGSESRCVIVVKKADGYSLDKATIMDNKYFTYYSDTVDGIIYFDDGTILCKGKTYDNNTDIRVFTRYNYELKEWILDYYAIIATKDDVVSCILYDKNDVEVAKLTEEVTWVSPKGHIITAKDGMEDGIAVRYWGCKYLKKTLVSSDDVIEELEMVEEGATVEVEVKKNDPMKAKVFESIKGKDVNLVVKIENGMSWTINGKNVTGANLKDINLTVDIVKDVVPAAAIDKVKLDGERIELSLAHTGDFGFKAELKMNVKAENAGKFANRFFYNPETKALEFQEAVKVDANGDAAFTYTHASDYVIILSDAAYDVTTPQTADMTNVGMLIAFLAVAAGAVVFTQKKRVSVK